MPDLRIVGACLAIACDDHNGMEGSLVGIFYPGRTIEGLKLLFHLKRFFGLT
jgi:hypothetical protein